MIRINGIKIQINSDIEKALYIKAAQILRISEDEILICKLVKKSVDARKKYDIHYVCSADVTLKCDEDKVLLKAKNPSVIKIEPTIFEIIKPKKLPDLFPVVCGFGPAGMFCALLLARAGFRPIVVERGGDVDTRTKAVNSFFNGGLLDTNNNVQFGEGGAGTFSDGKLTCGINDNRMSFILSEFVRFGANEDILYMAKPHIGTDVLKKVVKNLRKEIISLGGRIYFNTRLCDIKMKNGAINKILCSTPDGEIEFDTNMLVMAIGHSARDTFELLYNKGIALVQKQFSMGVRIEHLQSTIDFARYGDASKSAILGAADYKLSCKLKNGRGVYTFCMCPGGSVVAATSEKEGIVTNGMSLRARDGINSNAALLCDVLPSDFKSEHPLAGVEFQRKWEKAAYILGQKSYKAPTNLVGAFLQSKVASEYGKVLPTYKPGTVLANLDECMPRFVTDSLREAIPILDRKIHGFADDDAVMTGVETRSSSPVRIVRTKNFEIENTGIFPCGEGAGYAGGIMSASLDGIKVACEIIERYG